MTQFVSIVSQAKRAALISGLAGIRPMSTVKESPLHASQEDTRKWMRTQHSGRSPDAMGTSYDKCAAGPTFKMPKMDAFKAYAGRATQYASGKAQQALAAKPVQRAYGAAKQYPGRALAVGAGGALGLAGAGAGAYHGVGAFNKHVVDPYVHSRMVENLGGEEKVRGMLDFVGAPVAEGKPLDAAAVQGGVDKLQAMQENNWLAPVMKWWQSMDPKMQQSLLMGAGGIGIGGLLGGWQGAAAGGIGGALAPHAWPHAQQWLQQQGYMQPTAHN